LLHTSDRIIALVGHIKVRALIQGRVARPVDVIHVPVVSGGEVTLRRAHSARRHRGPASIGAAAFACGRTGGGCPVPRVIGSNRRLPCRGNLPVGPGVVFLLYTPPSSSRATQYSESMTKRNPIECDEFYRLRDESLTVYSRLRRQGPPTEADRREVASRLPGFESALKRSSVPLLNLTLHLDFGTQLPSSLR
jgi:hypothetical protein